MLVPILSTVDKTVFRWRAPAALLFEDLFKSVRLQLFAYGTNRQKVTWLMLVWLDRNMDLDV